MHYKILILDFGAQVHTTDRPPRARSTRLSARSIPATSSDEFVRDFAPRGIILSGSHMSAYEDDAPQRARKPCSSWACRCSASATACRPWRQQLGGRVEPGKVREFGYAEVRAHGHTALLDGIEDSVTPKATAYSRCG